MNNPIAASCRILKPFAIINRERENARSKIARDNLGGRAGAKGAKSHQATAYSTQIRIKKAQAGSALSIALWIIFILIVLGAIAGIIYTYTGTQ